MEPTDPKKEDPRRASGDENLVPFVIGSSLLFLLQIVVVVLLLVGLFVLLR